MDSIMLNLQSVRESLKKIGKTCMLAIGFQSIIIYADIEPEADIKIQDTHQDAHEETGATTQNSTVKPKTQLKTDTKESKEKKTKINTTKAHLKDAPLKTTVFFNGRINPILLVITNDKNKQFKINIKAGLQYEYKHRADSLKKVVCCEIYTANTTLSTTDLKNYAAFVFNSDQKLEKYNFITIQQKTLALKQAYEQSNKTLFDQISEQNIYYP